jgi:hypothetical protein
MKQRIAIALLGPAAIAITACGSDRASETIDEAEGEILTRSVTDDMIPYERLSSQPPLADPDEAEKADSPGEGGGAGSPSGTSASGEPAAEGTAEGGEDSTPDEE